jgi:hypothetical protein
MENLKLFENQAQYEQYTADTSNYIMPNVSLCLFENDVKYNPMSCDESYEYEIIGTPSYPSEISGNVRTFEITFNYSKIGVDSRCHGVDIESTDSVVVNCGVNPSTSDTRVVSGTVTWNGIDIDYEVTQTAFENIVTNYEYTGSYQKVTLYEGVYKLECWGAQGGKGGSSGSYISGGKGGYSVGTVTLDSSNTVYVYVGGQGSSSMSTGGGGFNGGGGHGSTVTSDYLAGGGGGASDIRIGTNSYAYRVIVAGGGGGSGVNSGGAGGGTSGTNGVSSSYQDRCGSGGTQTAGGAMATSNTTNVTSGSFGQGGTGGNGNAGGGGGGGGWYGGGGAGYGSNASGGAGGGSGYIHQGSNSASALGQNYILSDAATYAGNTSFPSTGGSTETGHSGNGYVRITQIG